MTREQIESLPDDDWRKRSSRFREPELSRSLDLVERLENVAQRHGVTAGTVAITWTLRRPAIAGAIVSFRRPDQVDPLLPAAELELTDEDVRRDRAGLTSAAPARRSAGGASPRARRPPSCPPS
jgi:aryl-alcohol dehydrogenase-like predicted oxidoreductase